MREQDIRDTVREAWDRMPTFRKVWAFLRMDHFVVGKVTLMDITICAAVFLAVGFTLAYRTQLPAPAIVFIPVLLSSVILFFRIRYRHRKKAEYLQAKLEKTRKHLEKVESEATDPEFKAQVRDALNNLDAFSESIGNYFEALEKFEEENRKGDRSED